MNRVKKEEGRSKWGVEASREEREKEARMAMIQMLIPLGLKAVEEELKAEVRELSGERYDRRKTGGRWGSNKGSVYLGDQKVRLRVPRVRDRETNKEIRLLSYERLQDPRMIEESALMRVINGISQRKYEKAVISAPETFGISRGSVSRRWIRASGKKLEELMNRSLEGEEIVSVIIDGKGFGENEIILALGVKITGEKMILGFIESSTENSEVCRDFLKGLVERGLRPDTEMLFVVDGGKGLYKGVKSVFGEKAIIQRCQWHKRENVLSYLSKEDKPRWRRRLQGAYEEPTYEKAKRKLEAIRNDLRRINESAARSLEEGLEETLSLHRLGLFEQLGTSLKTTNCIESVNRTLGIYTDRVCRWRTSDQRQRWVATALLEIEPRLRLIKGYKYLPKLREAMIQFVSRQSGNLLNKAA